MNHHIILALTWLAVLCNAYRPYQLSLLQKRRLPCTNSISKTKLYSTASSSIKSINAQMQDIRAQLAGDERTSLMMDALRGKNINDDDRQGDGIDMRVVEMRDSGRAGDVLPLEYEPMKLDAYFSRRPRAVATRVWQIVSTSVGFMAGIALDYITGNVDDIEVRRAAELRNTIVSLGPFFIKLGQALSIRPDILSPRAMVELQQLCDKVPCFPSKLAMQTIETELGRSIEELFSDITAEPVAAASLGQVYKATLRSTGDVVAVKVQRPFVLETVSLDLHLGRQLGLLLRNFPSISSRLDIVALLDEFAGNFYQELDYNLECANGIRIKEEMRRLPKVLIPTNYPQYTARKVHTAEWVEGEKLSQSTADDVSALVNLGVITYLTQLLDTGFFHADPHPGNMLRAPDGRLVILDFGLMTKITDDQKYGMIEAIAHLIHRDYDRIGDDFVSLDFIPRGTDTAPIVPALARVFEAALAGGGAKSINFQELAADLAEITFKFPFRIPPYFALIIRAISVLEGIALVGNPEFAIVDEAYPYISKRLMTDESPRLREAFRYMVYGKSNALDVDRMIDMLQALEKFVAVRDLGDGSAFKVDGMRNGKYVGRGGDATGTRRVDVAGSNAALAAAMLQDGRVSDAASTIGTLAGAAAIGASSINQGSSSSSRSSDTTAGFSDDAVRESLKFFFSDEGRLFREFVLDEVASAIDALSRDALRELVLRLGIPKNRIPLLFQALAPRLSAQDQLVVDNMIKLTTFLTGGEVEINPEGTDKSTSGAIANSRNSDKLSTLTSRGSQSRSGSFLNALSPRSVANRLLSAARDPSSSRQLSAYTPLLREFAPNIRQFGLQLVQKLANRSTSRLLNASLDVVFGPESGIEDPASLKMPGSGSISSSGIGSGSNRIVAPAFGFVSDSNDKGSRSWARR